MSPRKLFVALLAASALVATGVNPFAQSAGPQPSAMPAPTPAPMDVPYPGTIASVSMPPTSHATSSASTKDPGAGGQVTLLYPQWLPGNHAPAGRSTSSPASRSAPAARRLTWTRDPVDVYAFHVDVPAGATTLDVEFQFLSPQDAARAAS